MGAGPLIAINVIAENERQQIAMKRLDNLRRNLRDYSDPFLLPAEFFRERYRLTQHLAFDLIELLQDQLEGIRSTSIPVHLQVLATLKFLAEGSMQKGTSNDFNHPMAQSSLCKYIERVINAIISLSDTFIQFPKTREQRQEVSAGFHRPIRVRNILGIVDCFKVAMTRPDNAEHLFHNWAAGSSLNVQAITDSKNIIMDLRICPGSSTDHFIWLFSHAKQYMEWLRNNAEITGQEGPYYIIGDGGYVLSPILLTPVRNPPAGTPEYRYNRELLRTRCIIERTFGQQSQKWLGISRSRKLRYKPQKVSKIITACAILHNFGKLNGRQRFNVVNENHDFLLEFNENMDYRNGVRERNLIFNNYYN